MKTALLVGGPLVLFLGFSLYSDLLTYGEQNPGMVHLGGVESGGTFALQHKEVYQCDETGANCVLVEESTEFSEVEGLNLEEEAIEYREGTDSDYSKTKQPGIAKYGNIRMQRPTSFDLKSWKFIFEREAALDEVRKEFDQKNVDIETEAEVQE